MGGLDVEPPRVWLIAGPTASGKSALALSLAERWGGEIVNADSMQVYDGLSILTARPDATEMARRPHHLYGVADPAEAWSVGRWLRAAIPVLEGIRARGRTAIVVGGTGLYFRALTHGLAEVPVTPATVRDAVEEEFDLGGEAAFRTRLATLDPQAEARIEAGDRQRLVRALAVATATGRALSEWQADTRPTLAETDWRGVVVEPPRETLYARCDARLAAMIGAGALEEVRGLMARGLDPALPAMKAIGVAPLARHLDGQVTLAEALAQARQDTRNYAKRQSTWFRNQTPDWERVEGGEHELNKLSL